MDLKKLVSRNTSGTSLGKSLSRRLSTGSDASTSKRNRLSKLLSRKSSKRRDSSASTGTGNSQDLTLANDLPDVELNLAAESEPDDVVTLEQDEAVSYQPRSQSYRPSLSSHPSHRGFLTTSSPAIPAEPLTSTPDITASPNQKRVSLTSQDSGTNRSPSPTGRLREAFSPRTKSTDEESNKGGGIFRALSRSKRPDSTPPRLFPDQSLVSEPTTSTPSPPKKPAPLHILNTPPRTNAPTTFVTPPTPIDAHSDSELSTKHKRKGSDSSDTPRRQKTLASSKLSNSSKPPLTPAIEEIITPGGSLTSPTAGGFFSSVISAAQNVTSSISAITNPAKLKPASSDTSLPAIEEAILHTRRSSENSEPTAQPAIQTLGSGDLSLSHLGFEEGDKMSTVSSKPNLIETANDAAINSDEAAATREDNAATEAVNKAYERHNGDRLSPEHTRIVMDDTGSIRQSIEPDSSSIKRTGSIRSRLSGGRRRRTRGSSEAASLAQSTIPVARYAFASTKRNKDFHALFKSVPEDDLLIEDYSAAYQREILLQGRLYISEGHVCFWSNIFGYVTNLVMSFDEVISVEKKNTAMIFQNGIAIQTMHARHGFASLLSRDATYDLIISIWKNNNPNLKSSLNGNPIAGPGTGDKTERTGGREDDETASEEIYDEDAEDDEDSSSFVEARTHSLAGSDVAEPQKSMARKASNQIATGTSGNAAKAADVNSNTASAAATGDFPGPKTHEPTDCEDSATHCEKPLLEAIIPAPLGKVYALVFGPQSAKFMKTFLLEEEKCSDLQQLDESGALSEDTRSRVYNYIKPLGGAIGPKQTKCIITETVEQFDLNKAVSVMCSTQTPDVPSGNSFVTKTKYCLMWAPNNSTKLIMTYAVEWSGKSWLKVPIEKGAADGQLAYANSLVSALKAGISKSSKNKSSKSRKGRKREDSAASPEPAPQTAKNTSSPWALSNFNLSDPTNILFTLLGLVILILLFGRGRQGAAGGYGGLGGSVADRRALYEEAWRAEERELWGWIEQRVGMQAVPGMNGDGSGDEIIGSMRESMDMKEREIREAIRVTRERLSVLENALGGKGQDEKQTR